MRTKRLRTKMFHVWLHEKEFDYLNKFADANLLTASEVIRHWIHKSMKKEGLLKDISVDTKIKARRAK